MESRRRASRVAGPPAPPEPVVEPVALDTASERVEIPSEPPQPDEIVAEAAETMETALDVVTSSAASTGQPSINLLAPEAPGESEHSVRDSLTLARSQAALSRDLEAMGVEMAGMALSGIDSSARTAADMISVRTLSQVIRLNAGLACAGLDTLIGGSVRLSELGVKLASEAAQSMLAELGRNWLPPSRIS